MKKEFAIGKRPVKIIVASDSFKGSLTSMQVADAVESAALAVMPGCEVVKVNVADGGEGTAEALTSTLGGKTVSVAVSDPIGRSIEASYGILGGNIAVMEMSSASGLPLLSASERNPLITSTYGTGEMIAHALLLGCRKFLVGIGGSATNDAGTGMLTALGYRFYDNAGNQISGNGGNLSKICKIDSSGAMPELQDVSFVVACDVDNPFCGNNGAAFVFAPQKGADNAAAAELDKGLSDFASVIREYNGTDVVNVPGAGAAGGLGGAFLAFLDAKLVRGIDMLLDAIDFDNIIKGADLIITGEGKIDCQTFCGKTPLGVLQRARKQNIPVMALCGKAELPESGKEDMGFTAVVRVTPPDMPLEVALSASVAYSNVRNAACSALRKFIK